VAKRLESEFRREVRVYAEARGWRVHWEVDHRFKPSTGFPDLVLARAPEVLFRELKLDDTYLKATQDDWRRLLTAAGCDYDVWRPRDWDRIKQELE
jgi:hypothetical protein